MRAVLHKDDYFSSSNSLNVMNAGLMISTASCGRGITYFGRIFKIPNFFYSNDIAILIFFL